MTPCMKLFAAIFSTLSVVFASETKKHQLIVVGAGVSGFTAAATLLEHNVTDILVLEASDRIGGRIHTVQFGDVFIDKGAEFLEGGKGNSVYDLASPYDLLIPHDMLTADKFLFANTSGHGVHSIPIKALIDRAMGIFGEEEMRNVNGSMGDYFFPRLEEILTEEKVDKYLGEAMRHLVPHLQTSYIAADSLFDVGVKADKEVWEFDNSIVYKWKTGGYSTIFDIVSKKFPNASEELPVRNKTVLGKQVTLVERREGDVKVTCADGSTYLADHVIVTVSLGVLKKHAAAMFQPALPALKTSAIQAINFGCLAKVFLLFPNRWWPKNTTAITALFSEDELETYIANSTHGYWTANTTGFYDVMNHERMLLAWIAGKSCEMLDTLTDDQVIDGMMELLETLVGKMFHIPKPEKLLRSTWATNPYTLGSYSYRSLESDQKNLTNDDLAAPVLDGDKPVLLFAGEATHMTHTASVHGALDTGRREALRILNYRKEHPQL